MPPKPNLWANAPRWAKWAAKDRNGKSWFHEEKPPLELDGDYGAWLSSGCSRVAASPGIPGPWLKSLRRRPSPKPAKRGKVVSNMAAIIQARNALEALVSMYVKNPGGQWEFISCITPCHANELTKSQRRSDPTWRAWDDAREAIKSLKGITVPAGKGER